MNDVVGTKNEGTTVEKERQIKHEIVRLGESMNRVVTRINILLDRLIPALRPDMPTSEDKDNTVEPKLVEFATYIRRIRYIAERQASLINSALERLEI